RYHFELVGGQDLLDLVARVDGPRTYSVQLGVCPPVAQSLARLARFLKSQGQVVVRVGVGRSQRDGGLISADTVGEASSLVEHVAQVKVGERVLEINLDGFAVIALSQRVVLPVVIQRTQIDVSGSVCRIQLYALFVGEDGFVLCRRGFFQADPATE